MSIGDNIKIYREQKGFTQVQLGKEIGKSESSIRKYEGDIVKPPIDILNKLATALGVSVNNLLDKEPIDSEFKTIYVNDLIEQLEKFRDGKVAYVFIGEGNIQIDIDKFREISIEKAYSKCIETDEKDISIIIK